MELRKELQSLRSRVESLEQELKTKDEEMKRICKQQSLPIDQVSLQGRSQDERCKVNFDFVIFVCNMIKNSIFLLHHNFIGHHLLCKMCFI